MTRTAGLYGGSLYDLAAEEGIVDEIREQFLQVRQIFRDFPDYARLLGEQQIPLAERCSLIDQAFGEQTQHYLVNFIKLLCEKKLLGEIGGCCDEFIRRYNADRGITDALVYSAVALTKEQEEALRLKLEKLSGKSVHLTCKVDPRVLGGLKVEMDGLDLDGSVQGRLNGISRKIKEASLE